MRARDRNRRRSRPTSAARRPLAVLRRERHTDAPAERTRLLSAAARTVGRQDGGVRTRVRSMRIDETRLLAALSRTPARRSAGTASRRPPRRRRRAAAESRGLGGSRSTSLFDHPDASGSVPQEPVPRTLKSAAVPTLPGGIASKPRSCGDVVRASTGQAKRSPSPSPVEVAARSANVSTKRAQTKDGNELGAGMTAVITTRTGTWGYWVHLVCALRREPVRGSRAAEPDATTPLRHPRRHPAHRGGVPDRVRRDRRRRGHRERVPQRARDRQRLAARDALGRHRRRGRICRFRDASRRAADRPLRRTRSDHDRGGVPARGLRLARRDERGLALRRREPAARARLRRRRDAPHHDRGDGARPGPHGARDRYRFGRRQSRRARARPDAASPDRGRAAGAPPT